MVTTRTRPRPAIVVVDDDLGILAALRRLLRDEPYELLATTDPLEALRWVAGRNVRALMTDERMPQMAGSELLGWVRARFPELPCVVLTGYADTALVVAQKDLRIERLVTKPWDDQNLRELLRDLSGNGRPASAPAGCIVECEGKTDVEVLARILPEIVVAREGGRDLAVEIRRLDRLQGSLSRFLLSLLRLAAEQRVRVTLRDGSGLAATALGAIRLAESFVAAARTDEAN